MSYLSDQAYHQRQTSRRSDTLADPPQDPVVVKVGLSVQPGTFCTQTDPAKLAITSVLLIDTNWLPRDIHKRHMP